MATWIQIDIHEIPDIENIYAPGELGPYSVIIEKQDSNIIQIAKYLKFVNLSDYENIMHANKKTRTRFIVIYNNTVRANCLLRCEYLKQQDYKIFLPRIHGIIKPVPIAVTTQELMQNYTSYMPIIGAERFLRRNKETGALEQTETVKLTFRGEYKPDLIQIWNVTRRVSRYIPPPQQCTKCLRFGHVKYHCRFKIVLTDDAYNVQGELADCQRFYRNHDNKHWWNETIQRLWEEKQTAQMNHNKAKDLHTALHLRQVQSQLKMEIKRAQKKAFTELMDKFNEIL